RAACTSYSRPHWRNARSKRNTSSGLSSTRRMVERCSILHNSANPPENNRYSCHGRLSDDNRNASGFQPKSKECGRECSQKVKDALTRSLAEAAQAERCRSSTLPLPSQRQEFRVLVPCWLHAAGPHLNRTKLIV